VAKLGVTYLPFALSSDAGPIGVPQRDAGIELVRLGDEARLYDQILKNDWILKTDSENLRTIFKNLFCTFF